MIALYTHVANSGAKTILDHVPTGTPPGTCAHLFHANVTHVLADVAWWIDEGGGYERREIVVVNDGVDVHVRSFVDLAICQPADKAILDQLPEPPEEFGPYVEWLLRGSDGIAIITMAVPNSAEKREVLH